MLAPDGRLGLLVFVARTRPLPDQPSGNNFPTEDELRSLLAAAGFTVINSAANADFAEAPTYWREHADAVEAELERRHHDHPAWQTAARQSKIIGKLLGDGDLTGVLIVAGSSLSHRTARFHSCSTGHHQVVRPPTVARVSSAPQRGQWRPALRKSIMVPVCDPPLSIADRTASCTASCKIVNSVRLRSPLGRRGEIRACQRISSASRLPTPAITD